MLGVDTSNHNHPNGAAINWAAVAAAGNRFAILKVTEGVGFVDAYFRVDRAGAHAAGLIVGLYHFARVGDPVAQARYFLSVVGQLRVGEFVVVDDEDPAITPTWVKAFCDTVAAATSVRPLVYMNQSYRDTGDWSAVAPVDGLWLAKYDGTTAMPPGGAWGSPAMKQYTSSGTAAGIVGPVDLDVFYGTDQQLLAYGLQAPTTGGFLMALTDAQQGEMYARLMGFCRQRWYVTNPDGSITYVADGTQPGAKPAVALDTLDGNYLVGLLEAQAAELGAVKAELDGLKAAPAVDAQAVAGLVIAQLGQRINTPPA